MFHPFVLFVCLSLALALRGGAMPGDLDLSFTAATRGYASGSAFAVRADGSVFIGGTWDYSPFTVDFAPVKRLARMLPDGTRDRSFEVRVDFLRAVNVIVPEDDGSVLVGGRFDSVDGVALAGLARFLPNGQVDPNFLLAAGSGNATPSEVWCVARQPDGKILVGGNFVSYAGSPANRLVRLNPDGTRDATFQPAPFQTEVSTGSFVPGGVITHLVVQPDGRIFVAGSFDGYGGTRVERLIRLFADGKYDPGFQLPSGTALQNVSHVELEADGDLLLASDLTRIHATPMYLVRLRPDGTLAESFSNPALSPDQFGRFALGPNGMIYFGGTFLTINDGVVTSSDKRLVRIHNDLTLDETFPPVLADNRFSSLKENAGQIYCMGSFRQISGMGRRGIAVVNGSGALSDAFRPTGASDPVLAAVPKPDGHMILALGSAAATYDGFLAPVGLVEIDASGTFVRNFFGAELGAKTVALAPDGKVVAADGYRVARFNPDGTRDASFIYASSFLSTILAIDVQADGKVLLSGRASYLTGDPLRTGIVRLNVDGTIDASFSVTVPSSSVIAAVKVLRDGRILLGGNFSSVTGAPRRAVARLNANGSLDGSFAPNFAPSTFIYTLLPLASGEILVAGSQQSSAAAGMPLNGVARLLSDGTADPTFERSIGLDATGVVKTMAVQSDGRIMLGGAFQASNGVSRPCLVRLDPDGSLDSTFGIGRGPATQVSSLKPEIRAVLPQADGSIVVGGAFDLFGEQPRHHLVRLHGSGLSSAPVIAGSGTVHKNGEEDGNAVIFELIASDPAFDLLAWKSGAAQKGSIDFVPSRGSVQVTYRPYPNAYGKESVALIASNSFNQSDAVTLEIDIAPENDPPLNRQSPSLPGFALVGRALTANVGTWDDALDTASANLDFTFQWQVADDTSGLSLSEIPGSVAGTYTPSLADSGRFIRLVVTATDRGIGMPSSRSTSVATPWSKVFMPQTIEEWRASHFGSNGDTNVVGDLADPDWDGRLNLFEYFHGSDPLSADQGISAVSIALEQFSDFGFVREFLTLSYRIRPESADVACSAEVSTDLSIWSAGTESFPAMVEIGRQTNVDGTVTIKLRDAFSLNFYPRRYARLRVVRQ